MRLCHVIESAGTGAGQVVIDLSHVCATAGDEVTIICGTERTESRFIEEIAAMPGVNLVFSPMRRDIGLHDMADACRLLRLLRKLGPFDVIHGHSSKAGALARIAGVFFPKSVKVYTAHGFITLSPKASRLFKLIERFLSYFCDAVIAVSEGEGKHALSLGIAPYKINVIPNGTTVGAQTSRAQARRELGIDGDGTALGFVGRMEHPKNPALAINAFAEVHRLYPEIAFYLIGEGSLVCEAESALTAHGLQHCVKLLGYRNGRQLMPAFDALICSSDYETLPISFLEALSAGVPIITRRVGGVEEAIIEGETGFLAPNQTVDGLAQAMKAFAATTPEQRQTMSEKTRRHARLFTRERMGADTRALYIRLLSHD